MLLVLNVLLTVTWIH